MGRVARRVLLLALVMSLVVACGQGTPEDDPRPLTGPEAELLAAVRFNLHQQGTVPVTMYWPGSPSLTIEATLDLDAGLAYGTMTSEAEDGAAAVTSVVGWTLDGTAAAVAPEGRSEVPDLEDWVVRPLSTDNRQDIFLSLALTLGSDRPENPLLLRQSSARHLRADRVDGVDVAVFQGPRPAGDDGSSRTRFWIDGEGQLRRFEAYLGDAQGRLATVTVLDELPEIEGLRSVVAEVLRHSG